jgi:ribosomal protein S18 acetylase RimI-like enzyme
MPTDAVEIVQCPAKLRAESLALVLCELAPSLRREIAGGLLHADDAAELANDPLYVALRGGQLSGAAWGQRQSGNVAVFWPPQLAAGEKQSTAIRLAEAVVADLDQTSIEMAQVFLSEPAAETVELLRHSGFRHLADLLYMTCEAHTFPLAAPEGELEYVPYSVSQRQRLMDLISQTYEGTLDCTALNGVRDIDNVVNGYQATGAFRADNWQFVRSSGQDVGLLLLADHPRGRHWELMYMGVVPGVRGRGWGRQIARYAQWLARGANVDRIVLAVDKLNLPAVAMYRSSGFEIWDRRAVYVRFPANRTT